MSQKSWNIQFDHLVDFVLKAELITLKAALWRRFGKAGRFALVQKLCSCWQECKRIMQ